MSDCKVPMTTYQRPDECVTKREVSHDGTSHWYRCGHCHKPVNPGDDFCHKCGWRLINE